MAQGNSRPKGARGQRHANVSAPAPSLPELSNERVTRTRPRRRSASSQQRIEYPPGHPVTVKIYRTAPIKPGDVLAELARADLDTKSGAARFLSTFSLHPAATAPPTLEQLRLAQAVVRALEVALESGDHARNWKLVQSAAERFDSTEDRRRSVMAILNHVLEQRQPNRDLEFHAGQAVGQLAQIDPRFSSFEPSHLLELVRRERLGPVAIATKLSIQCGAFDDHLDDSQTKLARREKKVHDRYSAASEAKGVRLERS
jgi:hypothetical protein